METNVYQAPYVAAQASPEERAGFIRRTYTHLAGAILAFIVLEVLMFQSPIASAITGTLLGGRYSWLIVMVGFMGVSWVADKWARSDASAGMQYLGLSLYVVAQAIIFVPLLFIAERMAPGAILNAGIITALLFGGLTFTAFTTKSDFSWMRPILIMGSFVAVGVIVCSILFGFTLGLVFSGIMVLFAAGAILYSTANLLNQYRPDQHVAASLSLFASVALLFWYVLRILMSLSSSRN